MTTTTTNIPDMEDDFIPVPPPLMREMTGRVREENFIPMPRFLEREPTESGHKNEPLLLDGPDQAMVLTYLQYECKFDRCKYKGCTWGDIIRDNYDHFVELMAHEVYLDSNTFLALRGHVKEKDLPYVLTAVRYRDTNEGLQEARDVYLEFKCTHKGRHNDKSWRSVRATDYTYFVWAVGNTMQRHTKTFKILYECLDIAGKKYVDAAPRGEVRVRRNMLYRPLSP